MEISTFLTSVPHAWDALTLRRPIGVFHEPTAEGWNDWLPDLGSEINLDPPVINALLVDVAPTSP